MSYERSSTQKFRKAAIFGILNHCIAVLVLEQNLLMINGYICMYLLLNISEQKLFKECFLNGTMKLLKKVRKIAEKIG